MNRHREDGFTAVELLVTLFVAAIFLLAAYQVYSIVTNDSATTRSRSKASNIALDNARMVSLQFSGACALPDITMTTTPTFNPAPSIPSGSGLPNPSIDVKKDCPITGGPSRITATVSYGNTTPQEQATHVIYKY